MIQIDDTGSGSLIGGTGIGIYDTNTSKFSFEIIPIKYYQNMKHYQNKLYQDHVIKIIKKSLNNWQIDLKKCKIQICSSYIFDKTRFWFKRDNVKWQNTKIGSPLQTLVVKSFYEYLLTLGLPASYLKHTRYAFGFHRLLHWVYADRDTRIKLCKTCWKSFQQWGYLDYQVEAILNDQEKICLRCDKTIEAGSNCNQIIYAGKHNQKLLVHNICPL